MSRHGMKGPHGGMRGGAKAKDFKGSLKKLVKYMSVYKVQMLFVAVFAVCGTVFNIVGPKILGKATTEIFNGLVSKVSGGSSEHVRDFRIRIHKSLLHISYKNNNIRRINRNLSLLSHL